MPSMQGTSLDENSTTKTEEEATIKSEGSGSIDCSKKIKAVTLLQGLEKHL